MSEAPARSRFLPLLIPILVLAQSTQAQDHEDGHEDGHEHTGALHFTHPIVTESISPDRKLRLDYVYTTPGARSELEIEAEFAFHPAFSIEGGVHYDVNDGRLGDSHVIFKFGNYAFEERGVLLGYGISLGLPTGGAAHDHDDQGHGHELDEDSDAEDLYVIEPFLSGGLKTGPVELIGWTRFAIPARSGDNEVESHIHYDASALYRSGQRIDLLLELNGSAGLNGHAVGERTVRITPGLRIRPLLTRDFVVGIGLTLPLSSHDGFDGRALLSLFYHFD